MTGPVTVLARGVVTVLAADTAPADLAQEDTARVADTDKAALAPGHTAAEPVLELIRARRVGPVVSSRRSQEVLPAAAKSAHGISSEAAAEVASSIRMREDFG